MRKTPNAKSRLEALEGSITFSVLSTSCAKDYCRLVHVSLPTRPRCPPNILESTLSCGPSGYGFQVLRLSRLSMLRSISRLSSALGGGRGGGWPSTSAFKLMAWPPAPLPPC